METYWRDVMATALRSLDKVIAQIRNEEFMPDTTRSGVFAKRQPQPCSTSASSRSSSSRPCSDDANLTDAEPDEANLDVILNVATKIYHLAKDSEQLVCNKAFPDQFTRHEAPPPGARLCSRCW